MVSRVEKLGLGIIIEKDKVILELLKELVINMFENKNFRLNSEKIG